MADRIITVTDPSIVTNDTLLGYNNYSDIDGQLGTTMTPTEATNGHTVALSDGVVHEVTTKPVGTTNGEFSAVVSNAVTVDLSPAGGWSLSGASYDSVAEDISASDTVAVGLYFSSDGTKMFTVGNVTNSIYSWSLSPAWDISTATVGTPEVVDDFALSGMYFKDDGTALFWLDSNDRINKSVMSTPWDISTMAVQTKFTISTTAPKGLHMNPTGTKLFLTNNADGNIDEYAMSTPWDISTIGSIISTYDAASETTNSYGIRFNPDGTKMFICSQSPTDTIYEYTLSVGYDLSSTVTYSGNSLSVGAQDIAPRDIYIKPDGLKLFMEGITTNASIYQYSLT